MSQLQAGKHHTTNMPSPQKLYQSFHSSPLGEITLVAHDSALVGLWIDNQKHYVQNLQLSHVDTQETPVLTQTKSWLDAYFRGENPDPHCLPLDPSGSEFQLAVWRILATIPYGTLTTYGAIAKQIACEFHKPKMSAQAVGGAVGRNPISIIIPCHRVVGAAGKLTGYAGGLDKKRFLLQLEGVDLTQSK